jgi:hypothetical protein
MHLGGELDRREGTLARRHAAPVHVRVRVPLRVDRDRDGVVAEERRPDLVSLGDPPLEDARGEPEDPIRREVLRRHDRGAAGRDAVREPPLQREERLVDGLPWGRLADELPDRGGVVAAQGLGDGEADGAGLGELQQLARRAALGVDAVDPHGVARERGEHAVEELVVLGLGVGHVVRVELGPRHPGRDRSTVPDHVEPVAVVGEIGPLERERGRGRVADADRDRLSAREVTAEPPRHAVPTRREHEQYRGGVGIVGLGADEDVRHSGR